MRQIERKKKKKKFKITKRGVIRTTALLALYLMLTYCVVCLVFYFFQDDFLYQPTSDVTGTPADLGLEYQDITFNTSDGETLSGWFIPKEGADLTIFYCHGNAGNVGAYMAHYEVFLECGYNVFTFDYRGFGHSSGEPSEIGTYRDVHAAWTHLTEVEGVPKENIVVYGRSMGGPLAAWMGKTDTPGALVLESTFTSFDDAAKDIGFFLPIGLLSRFDYRTIDYVQKALCPVLIVHSDEDLKIRFHHGEELYDAANEPKEFLKMKGGHPDCIETSGDTYTDGLTGFIDDLVSFS